MSSSNIRGVLSPPKSSAIPQIRMPSERRSELVERYWYVRWDVPPKTRELVETLPYPSVHVVFEASGSVVHGVADARFRRWLEGRGAVFGIKFHPGTVAAVVSGSIAALHNRVVPFEAIWGARGRAFENLIELPEALDRLVEEAESWFDELDPNVTDTMKWLHRIVDLAGARPDIVRVEDLVEAAAQERACGMRTIQRLFKKYVGVSPKWVIQRFRHHEAAARIQRGETNFAAIALDLGYADQAHFIRDFRRVIGMTPKEYRTFYRS